jgi:allantoinase
VALSDRIPYQAQVDRPRLKLPGGKKLAIWVILNVEEWRIENAMPRTVLSPPMGQPLLPDIPNWSWHEYGMRAGFWRQFKALTDRNMPVTLAINANVCNTYPRVASAALESGFEFMATASCRARCTRSRTRQTRSSARSRRFRNSRESNHAHGKALV